MNKRTRQDFSLSYKIEMVKEYLKLPVGTSGRRIGVAQLAKEHGISKNNLANWVSLYEQGLLSTDNAIAVSHKPTAVITGDKYHIDGKEFATKEAAIRWAVESLGGITVTRLVTEHIDI